MGSSHPSLPELGWDATRAAELAAHPEVSPPARVVAVDRGRVHLAGPPCTPAHALMRPSAAAVTGDWVRLDAAGRVAAVLARRGVLARADEARSAAEPLVANVDAVVVCGGLDADFNLRRLERFAALGHAARADVVVALTKADTTPDAALRALDVRAALGATVPVVAISAATGEGLDRLAPWLRPARTTVLVGSSGVGKSTLVNALLGEARQRTQPVRAGDARGRHTTTRRELLRLPGGALLVDTPGLRLPRVQDAAGVASAFADVEALAAGCGFRDCDHGPAVGADRCAVRAAVAAGTLAPDRLVAYERLRREAAYTAARADERLRRERDAAAKRLHVRQRRRHHERPKGPRG